MSGVLKEWVIVPKHMEDDVVISYYTDDNDNVFGQIHPKLYPTDRKGILTKNSVILANAINRVAIVGNRLDGTAIISTQHEGGNYAYVDNISGPLVTGTAASSGQLFDLFTTKSYLYDSVKNHGGNSDHPEAYRTWNTTKNRTTYYHYEKNTNELSNRGGRLNTMSHIRWQNRLDSFAPEISSGSMLFDAKRTRLGVAVGDYGPTDTRIRMTREGPFDAPFIQGVESQNYFIGNKPRKYKTQDTSESLLFTEQAYSYTAGTSAEQTQYVSRRADLNSTGGGDRIGRILTYSYPISGTWMVDTPTLGITDETTWVIGTKIPEMRIDSGNGNSPFPTYTYIQAISAYAPTVSFSLDTARIYRRTTTSNGPEFDFYTLKIVNLNSLTFPEHYTTSVGMRPFVYNMDRYTPPGHWDYPSGCLDDAAILWKEDRQAMLIKKSIPEGFVPSQSWLMDYSHISPKLKPPLAGGAYSIPLSGGGFTQCSDNKNYAQIVPASYISVVDPSSPIPGQAGLVEYNIGFSDRPYRRYFWSNVEPSTIQARIYNYIPGGTAELPWKSNKVYDGPQILADTVDIAGIDWYTSYVELDMNDYVGPNYFSFHSMWFLDGVGWFQNVGTSIVSAPDHGFWTYPFPINIPKHVFGEVETDAYRGSYREIPVETKLASFTREGATTCVRDGLYFKIRSNLLFTGVPTSDPENYNVEGPTKLAHNSTKYALITRSDGKTYDIYAGWSPIGYGDGSYTIGFPYSLLFDYDNLIYVPNRKTKERITVTVCHIYRYEAYGYYLSSLGTRIYEIFEFNEDYTLREHRIEIPHTKEKIIL